MASAGPWPPNSRRKRSNWPRPCSKSENRPTRSWPCSTTPSGNLADAFKALAAEALKSNNQSFLELAKASLEKFQETAKGDMEKRQQAIHELVKPVRESLDKVDAKINEWKRPGPGPTAA